MNQMNSTIQDRRRIMAHVSGVWKIIPLVLGLTAMTIDPVRSSQIETVSVVYSEALNTEEAVELRGVLDSLGASNCSDFPYVAHAGNYAFVNFSQIKKDAKGDCPHGNGSISVVAVRHDSPPRWSYFTPDQSADQAQNFLNFVGGLNVVTAENPLVLRTHAVYQNTSGVMEIRPLGGPVPTIANMALWSPVQRHSNGAKYLRTGYNTSLWETWLFESDTLFGDWTVPSKCGPIAKQPGLDFSEASVAPVGPNKWLALIREDSAVPNSIRYLYQSTSNDDGCTWTAPKWVGDGTQPHILRVDLSPTDSRLIMTVGDRVSRGWTKEIGIQCRVSSNLHGLRDPQEIQWGPPRMIYEATASSNLGQPGTIAVSDGRLETFFYADRGAQAPDGAPAGPDILSVVHQLAPADFPENTKNIADLVTPSVPLFDDFDGNTAGVPPRHWSVLSGVNAQTITDDSVYHGVSGKSVHLEDRSASESALMQCLLEPMKSIYIKGSFRFKDSKSEQYFPFMAIGNKTNSVLVMAKAGEWMYLNGGGLLTRFPNSKRFDKERWYDIETQVDFLRKTFTVWIDAELIGQDIPLPGNNDYLAGILIQPGSSLKQGEMWVDDVYIGRESWGDNRIRLPSVTLTFTLPSTSLTQSQSVLVSATATDTGGVKKVWFIRNGVVVSTDTAAPYEYNWAITGADNGTHSWSATAFDIVGNSTTTAAVPVTVNIDVTAPEISISSSTIRTVSYVPQTISVTAEAVDHVGVSKVWFIRNNVVVSTDVAAPYAYTWSITGADIGTHTLTAQAFDAAGNHAISQPHQILVDTSPPTTPSMAEVTVDRQTLGLSWSEATDEGGGGVAGYRVDLSTNIGFSSFVPGWNGRNVGVQLTTRAAVPMFDTVYYARVQAVDAAGNLSLYSTVKSATVGAFIDDFEAEIDGTSPSRWSVSLSSQTNVVIKSDVFAGNSGKSANLSDDNSAGSSQLLNYTGQAISAFYYRANVRFKEKNAPHNVLYGLGNEKVIYFINAHSDGTWSYYNGTQFVRFVGDTHGYASDTWYQVEVRADLTRGRFSVWIDRNLVGDNITIPDRNTSISGFGLRPASSASKGTMWVDDVLLTTVLPFFDNFESETTVPSPSRWIVYSSAERASVTMSTESAPGGGTKSVSLADDTTSGFCHLQSALSGPQVRQFYYRANYRFRENNVSHYVLYGIGGANTIYFINAHSDGYWSYYNGSSFVRFNGPTPYLSNTWYQVEVRADLTRDKFSVWINRVLVGKDITIPVKNISISKIGMQPSTARGSGAFWADNIFIENNDRQTTPSSGISAIAWTFSGPAAPLKTVNEARAYPSPFRPGLGAAGITFDRLPEGAPIKILTTDGRLVRTLTADSSGATLWDLTNEEGHPVGSGVYVALMEKNGGRKRLKVVVQK